MIDKDELKDSLTTEDINKIFEYFNVDSFVNKQGVLQAETACHNRHGGSHKLYYYPDSQQFHCFTDCAENFNIFDLVIKIQETRGETIDFKESLNLVASILGISTYRSTKPMEGFNQDKKLINDWDWINKVSRRKKITPTFNYIDDKFLSKFEKWFTLAWYEEGISIETQKKFHIRYYPERNQTVIPHRDPEGRIIGVRVRNWNEDALEYGKYMPLYYKNEGYTHPLGFNLYGLYENKEAIKKHKKVVIVEGEKSAMISHSMFGDNNFCVALCGSSMNQYQADLLLDLGVREVMIAMDKEYIGDEPDEDYMEKVNKIARLFVNKVDVYHLTDTRFKVKYKQCMLDMGKDVVIDVMENDKHKIVKMEA